MEPGEGRVCGRAEGGPGAGCRRALRGTFVQEERDEWALARQIGHASVRVALPKTGEAVLVCHCKSVFDRDVRNAIAAGARDEFDVAAACGAGTGCGGCVPTISALLAEQGCAPGCPVVGALRRHAAEVGAP